MIQIILVSLGIVIVFVMLAWVFRLKLGRQSWQLISLAAATSAVSIAMIRLWPSYDRGVNFIEHALGGGVPSAFMLFALLAAHKRRFTWLQELVLLFFFVSGTGALNELLELFGDTVTAFEFSIDRFDTWYDILANSLGALLGWIVWKATLKVSRINR